MNSTDTSRHELITSCQRLVKSLARKLHSRLPRHVELDDLVAFGQVGLAEAARDFDPQRGHSFTTFAYYRVRGAMLDGLSKMAWFKRADYARIRYESLANEALELANADGESSELKNDARWLTHLGGTLAMVYLCSHAAGDESDPSDSLEDRSAESPTAIAIRRETVDRLRRLIDALPPDAAALIRATYFEGLTLKEAGQRIGIGKAWASRLHARTLDRLRRALRQLDLND